MVFSKYLINYIELFVPWMWYLFKMQNCLFLKWKNFSKLLLLESSTFCSKRNANVTQGPWHITRVKKYHYSETCVYNSIAFTSHDCYHIISNTGVLKSLCSYWWNNCSDYHQVSEYWVFLALDTVLYLIRCLQVK